MNEITFRSALVVGGLKSRALRTEVYCPKTQENITLRATKKRDPWLKQTSANNSNILQVPKAKNGGDHLLKLKSR